MRSPSSMKAYYFGLVLLCSVLISGVWCVPDHKLDSASRGLPYQQYKVESIRQRILADIARTQARMRQLSQESDHHAAGSFLAWKNHLLLKHKRVMNEVDSSAKRLKELGLAVPPQLLQLSEMAKQSTKDVEHDVGTTTEAAQHLALEENAAAAAAAVAAATIAASSAPLPSTSTSSSPSSSPSSPSTPQPQQPPATASSPSAHGGAEGAAAADGTAHTGPIHTFRGLPKHIQFQIGSQGTLDCTCRLRVTDQCDGGSTPPEDGRPWMPGPVLSDKGVPLLSAAHCYDSCQEHKCTPVFQKEGWDAWHQCVETCVKKCYGDATHMRMQQQQQQQQQQQEQQSAQQQQQQQQQPQPVPLGDPSEL